MSKTTMTAAVRVRDEETAKGLIRSLMAARGLPAGSYMPTEPIWWVTRRVTDAELELFGVVIDPAASGDHWAVLNRAYEVYGIPRAAGGAYCGPLADPAAAAAARRSVPSRAAQLAAAGVDYAANRGQFGE